MSTPAKSFEDLRSILGKLDRKIDSARSRRLGLDSEPVNGVEDDGGPLIGRAEPGEDQSESVESPAVSDVDETAARRRSPYGRAKPLNRGGNGLGNGSAWLGGS